MPTDRFGQSLATGSERAAEHYVAALDRLFALRDGVVEAADRAIAEDPGFALAYSVRARGLAMAGRAAEARENAVRGDEVAAAASPREWRHARIARLVAEGAGDQALPLVIEHALEHPRDAMPLSYALGVYGLLGFGGFADFRERQCRLLAQVAPAWEEDWWFLASYGWALVEAGDWAAGIPMLDRSLELEPDNANAVHGRVHGHYECGEADAGEAFLAANLPRFPRSHPLHGHLSWHLALFAMQRGDIEAALGIYRDGVAPKASEALPMFTIIDSASFLWRAALHGLSLSPADTGELVRFIGVHQPRAGLPFVNAHVAMALGLARDESGLAALRDGVEELVAAGRQPSGTVIADLCRALSALAGGDSTAAGEILERRLADLPRLGGSNAQRDLFIDSLVFAHGAAGEGARAVAAMARRAQARAGHLDGVWMARLAGAEGVKRA